ncbi:MAG: hypothetical protein ACPIOQ_31070, partial [Promethearchaeia archaeon]
ARAHLHSKSTAAREARARVARLASPCLLDLLTLLALEAPRCLLVVLFSYLKSGMPAVCARGQIWNSFRGRWRSSSATRSVRQGNRVSTTVYHAL